MGEEAQSMIEFLMRSVKKLEAENTELRERITDFEKFLEPQREFYEDNHGESSFYFALMGGPREGNE